MKKSSVAIMKPILAGYMPRRNIESCAIAGGIPSAARIGTREKYQSISTLTAGRPDFLIQIFTTHAIFLPGCNHHVLDMATVPDKNIIAMKHQIPLDSRACSVQDAAYKHSPVFLLGTLKSESFSSESTAWWNFVEYILELLRQAEPHSGFDSLTIVGAVRYPSAISSDTFTSGAS